MKETIITAKMPYASLFEGLNGDFMNVFRIVSKKKNGFDELKSYLKKRLSDITPDCSEAKVINWLLSTTPVYIKELKIENDNILTTVIYPFNNCRGQFGTNVRNIFSSRVDNKISSSTCNCSYRGGTRTTIYLSGNLKDIDIELAEYDRLLRLQNYSLMFNKPEIINNEIDFYDGIKNTLKMIDKIIVGPAIKMTGNPKKEYTHNSMVKTVYKIYDNIIDMFNQKENGDLYGTNLSNVNRPIPFGRFEQKRSRNMMSAANKFIYKPYRLKLKAYNIEDKIIFYDGKKGLDYFKDKVLGWPNTQLIVLLQYAGLEFSPMLDMGVNREKVIIRFMNPKDYNFEQRGFQTNRNSAEVSGRIWYRHKVKRFNIFCNFSSENDYTPRFEGIIPIGDKTEEAIEKLDELLKQSSIEKFENYFKTLLMEPTVSEEEDILTTWFSSCVRNKQRNDDNLLRAYRQMKYRLLQEYKALEDYVTTYDFSKVLPVPRIEMDKKAKENFYKSLHVQAKNIKINNVNNKKIKEINKTQAMVDMMFTQSGNIFKENFPLTKYYNPTKNTLEFNYNKMKGELIHDKIKNRG